MCHLRLSSLFWYIVYAFKFLKGIYPHALSLSYVLDAACHSAYFTALSTSYNIAFIKENAFPVGNESQIINLNPNLLNAGLKKTEYLDY